MTLELHHNALSTCSQKLRLVLAEKGVDFVSHEIDLVASSTWRWIRCTRPAAAGA